MTLVSSAPSVSTEAAMALSVSADTLGYARPVLRGVSLEVPTGECVALLGGNGTGKTTLLKSIVGLVGGNGVDVRIHGVRVAGRPENAVRAGAGLVFQNPDDQLFCATPLEDVLFGPRNQGCTEDEAQRLAANALTAMEALTLADREVETLSFGEKKRVCIAAVLAMQPSLLLLDEPTAGLDPAGEMRLLRLLRQLSSERRVTVIIATHAVDLVGYLATRMVLIGDGRILADGSLVDVFADEACLHRARVRSPWVLQLWRHLGPDATRLPLTVPQAVELLRSGPGQCEIAAYSGRNFASRDT